MNEYHIEKVSKMKHKSAWRGNFFAEQRAGQKKREREKDKEYTEYIIS